MLRIESGVPGTHGATLIIQYADQAVGEITYAGGRCRAVGSASGTGRRDSQVIKISRLARARPGRGNVETKPTAIGHSCFRGLAYVHVAISTVMTQVSCISLRRSISASVAEISRSAVSI